MRKDYTLDNNIDLAWGFDRVVGFFIQVFEGEDEHLVLSMDQGEKLDKDMPFQEEYLSYEKMEGLLETYHPKALEDFHQLLALKLDKPVRGCNLLNANGAYQEVVWINNLKEFFHFVDNIAEGYILTNFLDFQVDVSYLTDQLKEKEQTN